MARRVRISLANKCQLLFGTAVVLILASALTVLAVRMQTMVHESQEETARQLGRIWLAGHSRTTPVSLAPTQTSRDDGFSASLIGISDFDAAANNDAFLAEAVELFRTHRSRNEFFTLDQGPSRQKTYRYAYAIRRTAPGTPRTRLHGGNPAPETAAALEQIMLIRLPADRAQRQLVLNRVYIIAAGVLAGLLAIGTFWFITTRIILSPVRVLRDTAAKVSEGDLNIRADINTGDEFEQMSHMFNTMLENLKSNQDQLRGINKSLDLKLGELAQHNVSLHEANVIKGKFLANVSHELRTPLNSIIGFAEVLSESVHDGAQPTGDKRKRYIANIITSSRQLLDLINDLLDLAKIEAGRMELRVSALSIRDSAEGLVNLMRPQAEKRNIELRLQIERNIPLVHTDAGKFQQVLFNFLSNAIKFTPPGGTVTLSAKLLNEQPHTTPDPTQPPLLCVGVSDTGPGIPLDQQDHIFEKFTQIDSTVTREHGGTGLGLAICRELAALLQGRVELVSDRGKGAVFSLIMPLTLASQNVPLMPETPPTTLFGPHTPLETGPSLDQAP